jgi:hypothetical protein
MPIFTGMRSFLSFLAVALALAATQAHAGVQSAHFRVGVQVIASARLVSRPTAAGVGLESRSFGGEARALLVEQRSGTPISIRTAEGAIQVPREGSEPLLVRSASELAFDATGPAEIVVTLLADGLPPALQKLNVTTIVSR